MEKIFEMLGVDKLDESKQTELKETLQTVIELKAQDIAESKVEDLVSEKKQELSEEYESKFNTYKDSVTSKFSNFVDNVIDEEMVIPGNIVKYARLGELYEDLIEQFKIRLSIDEGIIDTEVREMLSEAKDEILGLRDKLDENTGEILELEKDASEMAASLYIRKKCDGLTESQKGKVIDILGDEIIKENIDKKFKTIIDTLNIIVESDDEDEDEGEEKEDGKTFEAVCDECGNKETVKEGADMTCPECGAKMKKGEKSDKEKKSVDESKGPWKTYQNIWLDSLKTD